MKKGDTVMSGQAEHVMVCLSPSPTNRKNIDEAAKKYGFEGNYVDGANIAGFERVVDAMNAQGIV